MALVSNFKKEKVWPKFTFLESPPSRYGLVDPRTLSIPLTLFDIWKVSSKMTFTFPAILYSATLFLLYLSIRYSCFQSESGI